MKKKTYWREITSSVTGSKGRFISIFSLMALASFALVGLQVTSPNMNKAGNAYLNEHHTQDLLVTAPLGLTDEDEKKLSAIKGTQVEFGQSEDVTIKGHAWRLYSPSKDQSLFVLKDGRLPQTKYEIAIDAEQQNVYPIGSWLSLEDAKPETFAESRVQVVGYVTSADILSKKNMGRAQAASGQLEAYGVLNQTAFKESRASFARIGYEDLKGLDAFGATYRKRVEKHEDELEDLVDGLSVAREKSVRDEAEAKLDSGRRELAQAEKSISDSKQQLEAARAVLPQEQVAKQDAAVKEAEKKLAEQKASLADKEQEIKDLKVPGYTVAGRSSWTGAEGYQIFSNSFDSIKAVATVFPVVLYLVAALVSLTTMTRFVDEERIKSGTLRALGYDQGDVIFKFVFYGLLSGGLGTLVGIGAGHYFLSPMISNIIMKDSLISQVVPGFYWTYSLLALGMSLLATVLPAWWVARRELKEVPASLLLPKPPKAGSRILLERIGVIWSRLSFTHKVTARNIFRYKQRMFMTIFGVAGSVALLFAGLGIQSSISGVADRQFDQVLRYQMMVVERPDAKEADMKALLDRKEVKSAKKIGLETFSVRPQKDETKQLVTVMAASDFNDDVLLRNRAGQDLSVEQGAILSEKLALLYGVGVGDQIEVSGHRIKVAGVTENYSGHFIYLTDEQFKDIFGRTPNQVAYLVRLRDASAKGIEQEAKVFLESDSVGAVSQNLAMKRSFETVAKSLASTMLILVVVSVLLAVVILYNLTNINVSERIRELSTVKVLGFFDKEVMLYIYRETILLSLIGLVLGLVSGYYLHQVLIGMIAGKTILFNPTVGGYVYLVPVAVLGLLVAGLAYLVYQRLRHVDMLEALKSVE